MLARQPPQIMENRMMSTELRPPIQPGEAAPPFVLPAVNRDGMVSLDDFRGKSALFIGLFRGLHCPFCRRQVVLLGSTQDKLRVLGVETMAVINTPLERARFYYKHKPARVLLGRIRTRSRTGASACPRSRWSRTPPRRGGLSASPWRR
jgi:hypothetical protein